MMYDSDLGPTHLMIPAISISETQAHIVAMWRNDFETRRNSHNSDRVEPREFFKTTWQSYFKTDIPGPMFLEVISENDVSGSYGVVAFLKFERRTDRIFIGIVVNPRHRSKGYGTEAIKQTTQHYLGAYPFLNLYAEVYADNESSLRAFTKAGYKEQCKTMKGKRELITMRADRRLICDMERELKYASI